MSRRHSRAGRQSADQPCQHIRSAPSPTVFSRQAPRLTPASNCPDFLTSGSQSKCQAVNPEKVGALKLRPGAAVLPSVGECPLAWRWAPRAHAWAVMACSVRCRAASSRRQSRSCARRPRPPSVWAFVGRQRFQAGSTRRRDRRGGRRFPGQRPGVGFGAPGLSVGVGGSVRPASSLASRMIRPHVSISAT